MSKDYIKETIQAVKITAAELAMQSEELEAACENIEEHLLNNEGIKLINITDFTEKLKSEKLYTSELERFIDDYFRFNS